MKSVAKLLVGIVVIIVLVFLAYFVGSGFNKNASVYVNDYTISDDGTHMAVDIGIASSVGYVRKADAHQQDDGRLCVSFFSAFGGINGRIGAKRRFVLPLEENTTTIAVYRGSDQYEDVLFKDADGVWQAVQH